MLRKTLMAGAAATMLVGLPVATIPAFAQNAPSATTPSSTSFKANMLIGRNVLNKQNEKIGDINSVYLDQNGKVDSVIVGVGGFLGVGEREVALKWSDLTITNNGDKIVVDASKDQLKAMPEYKYADKSYRGSVFSDKGVTNPPMTPATRADRAGMDHDTQGKHNPAMSANGNMSANAIIGADVRNSSNETIGKVQDIYVNKDGAIKGVIVGVGGFLGIGERNVMLSWNQVQLHENRDHDGVVITTDATKDSLKAMPEYKESSL